MLQNFSNTLYFYIELYSDEKSISYETIQKNRNIFYQKRLANEIQEKVKKIISLLSLSINIHLNLEQNLIINTSKVFSSLKTLSFQSLSNQILKQVGNALVQFPSQFNSNLNQNQTISLRVNYFFFFQFFILYFF